jgi:hypothetical protein
MERMRLERHQMGTEDHFKSIKRHTQHIQMIDMADKKCVYNLIKKMVDDEMKANEHLFIEDCPKYVRLLIQIKFKHNIQINKV